jgi:hypothetical protein
VTVAESNEENASMNDNGVLILANWIETGVVAAILLASAAFLSVITVRFFRGKTRCSCTGSPSCCPAARTCVGLSRLAEPAGEENDK